MVAHNDDGREGAKGYDHGHNITSAPGQQDEENALRQNQNQGIGVRQTEADTHRVDKEGIQAHAAGPGQGQIGRQSRQDRTDDS